MCVYIKYREIESIIITNKVKFLSVFYYIYIKKQNKL